MATPFKKVYDAFLDKITDDMYVELTPLDTQRDMQAILINSIPKFEFPKKSLIYDRQEPNKETGEDNSSFFEDLDLEEINILANLMLINWLQRQITSIDNTRQKTWQDRLLHYARNIHKQKVYAALSNTLFSSGLS